MLSLLVSLLILCVILALCLVAVLADPAPHSPARTVGCATGRFAVICVAGRDFSPARIVELPCGALSALEPRNPDLHVIERHQDPHCATDCAHQKDCCDQNPDHLYPPALKLYWHVITIWICTLLTPY